MKQLNKKTLDIIEKQVLRGRILNICEKAQPYGAGFEMIEGALKKEGFFYEKKDITEACSYLQQKKLISIKTVKNTVFEISRNISMITAKGIDFLEGSIIEDGIVLAEE